MEEVKHVYVLSGEFNSEEDNDDFCTVYYDKEKAIDEFKRLVQEEKESDFVKGNSNDTWNYETYCDYSYYEDSYIMGCYFFGSKDSCYYTKLVLRCVEVL